jgi:translation initiation factor IF-2
MAGKILVKALADRMGITVNEILFYLRNFGINKSSGDEALTLEEAQALLSGDLKATQKSLIIREDKKEKAHAKKRDIKVAPLTRVPAAEAAIINIPVKKTKEKPAEEPAAEVPEAAPAPAPPAKTTKAPKAPAAAPPTAPSAAPPAASAAARPAVRPQIPKAGPRLAATRSRIAEIPNRPRPAPPRSAEPAPAPAPASSATPGAVRPGAPPARTGGPAAPPGAPSPRPGAPGARPRATGGPSKPAVPAPGPVLKTKKEDKKAPAKKKGKIATFEPESGPSIDLQQFKGKAIKTVQEIHDVTEDRGAKMAKKGRKVVEEEVQHVPLSLKEQVRRLRDAIPQGIEVVLAEGQTLRHLMDKLGVKVKDFMPYFMDKGMSVSINQPINQEFTEKIAADLGFTVKFVSFEEGQKTTGAHVKEKKQGDPRPPIVTVMGHVDHGKTTLLDTIRKARVAASEEGGITQHIGAYEVMVHGKKIVFVDTPGHEAFTFMRARGAQVTDIVILVVAADDGIMPQTVEAINHAKAAGVPLIVAINKIDKGNANIDAVYKGLAERGLQPEAWGGQTVCVPVSALKGDGVQELLEMVLLVAEMQDLRADTKALARGIVLESRKDVGRGILATLIVQEGTLKRGDNFICGSTWGKVRAMVNDHGAAVQEAGPGSAVELMGFEELPSAGDAFAVVHDEAEAKKVVDLRKAQAREERLNRRVLSIEDLLMKDAGSGKKGLFVLLKADTNGALEVLKGIVKKQEAEGVEITIVHEGVGAISYNDVMLASASKAMVIGFNVRPEKKAADLAKQEKVEVRLYTVVFTMVDELKQLVAGMVEPVYKETVLGQARVKKTFRIPKVGHIAGCEVIAGLLRKGAMARLLRDNAVVHEGRLTSLRRFTDDVEEVREGQECGISLERYSDVKEGDVIEAIEKKQV